MPDIRSYVIVGPAHHRDEHWDLVFMALDYGGQAIELAEADGARYWDAAAERWVPAAVDFAGSELREVLGLRVPVISKDRLVDYKRRLGRVVDRLDLRAMGAAD